MRGLFVIAAVIGVFYLANTSSTPSVKPLDFQQSNNSKDDPLALEKEFAEYLQNKNNLNQSVNSSSNLIDSDQPRDDTFSEITPPSFESGVSVDETDQLTKSIRAAAKASKENEVVY
jgi:hypothetical protein